MPPFGLASNCGSCETISAITYSSAAYRAKAVLDECSYNNIIFLRIVKLKPKDFMDKDG
jgi:hypothetical protein